MATIIQSRNDTATNWATVNPILAQGEIGIELDTRKFKVGDGINDWNNLPYFVSGGGSVESVNGQTGVVVLDAEDVGALPDSTVIPTKTSDLTNDSNFATVSQIPTNNNQLINGAGYITSASLPTKVSDLTNDTGFVTNTVNNLTNYYLKTETYTQLEVNQLIAGYIKDTDYAGYGHISNKSATNKYLSPSTIDDVASVSARSVYDKSATISNGTINLDEGCVFYTHSPSTNTTYTINTSALTQSGFPCRYFNVVITMPSVAVTCDFTTNNNVTWTENRTPDMSTGSRTYLLAFQTFDGGTNWVGSLCTWWE